jgi:hypothetical protein
MIFKIIFGYPFKIKLCPRKLKGILDIESFLIDGSGKSLGLAIFEIHKPYYE